MTAADVLGAACAVPHRERERILLGHGSGGVLTAQLIEEVLLPELGNPVLARLEDQAQLPVPVCGRLAFTTDSYVVSPLFFPGSDIGELAVNGTVNDLAVGGARPLALSLAFILEEGLEIALLERVVRSVRRAADRAGVAIVTGDTKVVDHGKGDKLFINTAGIGAVPAGLDLGSHRLAVGDAIIVSGTVGDHGMAVIACREGLLLEGALESDSAALADLIQTLLAACPEVHAMRDPTRGGVAATLVEMAGRRQVGIRVDEAAVPVNDAVRGACELLGLDPLLVANEGKVVVFVPRARRDDAIEALRGHPLGRNAVCIGEVVAEHPGLVVLTTPLGSKRILDLPYAEPLPRIC